MFFLILFACGNNIFGSLESPDQITTIEAMPAVTIENSHSFVIEERTFSSTEEIPILFHKNNVFYYSDLSFDNKYSQIRNLGNLDLSSDEVCFFKKADYFEFFFKEDCMDDILYFYEPTAKITEIILRKRPNSIPIPKATQPHFFFPYDVEENSSSKRVIISAMLGFEGDHPPITYSSMQLGVGGIYKLVQGFEVSSSLFFDRNIGMVNIFNGQLAILSILDSINLYVRFLRYSTNPIRSDWSNFEFEVDNAEGFLLTEEEFGGLSLDNIENFKPITCGKGIFAHFSHLGSIYLMKATYSVINSKRNFYINEIKQILSDEPRLKGSFLCNDNYGLLFFTYLTYTKKVELQIFDVSNEKIVTKNIFDVATSNFDRNPIPYSKAMTPRLALIEKENYLLAKSFYTTDGPSLNVRDFNITKHDNFAHTSTSALTSTSSSSSTYTPSSSSSYTSTSSSTPRNYINPDKRFCREAESKCDFASSSNSSSSSTPWGIIAGVAAGTFTFTSAIMIAIHKYCKTKRVFSMEQNESIQNTTFRGNGMPSDASIEHLNKWDNYNYSGSTYEQVEQEPALYENTASNQIYNTADNRASSDA